MAIVRRENMQDLMYGYLWNHKEKRSGKRWEFCVENSQGLPNEKHDWFTEHEIPQTYILDLGVGINMYFFNDETEALMFYLRWG